MAANPKFMNEKATTFKLNGNEIDASIGHKFKERYGILFKFASFKTDSPAYGDTNKVWAQLTADF